MAPDWFPTPSTIYNNAPLIALGLAGLFIIIQAKNELGIKTSYKALRRREFPAYPIPPFQGAGYGYYFDTPESEVLNQVDWGGDEY